MVLSDLDNYPDWIKRTHVSATRSTRRPPQDEVFHRSAYAQQMADQLLRPQALQTHVRSGVLLSGIRRVGKTTFLRQDFVPAAEAAGALVVYVDLWADRAKSPAALVHEAVRDTLRQLQTPGSAPPAISCS
jgi:hypothetical protein